MLRLADLLRRLALPTPDQPQPSRASSQLSFFDHALSGPSGAQIILDALAANGSASTREILASQNNLRDVGVRNLALGLKGQSSVQSLNLSANGLTDASIHIITLHLLAPLQSTLRSLYLNANLIKLNSSAAFLAQALSNPTSPLQLLSLTSNSISAASLDVFLQNLQLSPPTIGEPHHSRLNSLHLSVCTLDPSAVLPLAHWLEDPHGGAERLQVLALNGNNLSDRGVRRIAQTIIEGRCVGLVSLELLANDVSDEEEWEEVIAALGMEDGDERWKEALEAGLARNRRVLLETRKAGLETLVLARTLFSGNPLPPPSTDSERAVGSFPFLLLPPELQLHVLRCSLLLTPSSETHLYPPRSPIAGQLPAIIAPPFSLPTSPVLPLSSPLTEVQFLSVLAFAMKEGSATEVEKDDWVEETLREMSCDRFDRGGPRM